MSRDDRGNGWDPNQDVEPEASLFASIDPLAFGEAFVQAAIGMVAHAGDVAEAALRCSTGLMEAGAAAASRMVGADTPGPIAPDRKDRRFADPAWEGNAAYFYLQQAYLLWGRFVRESVTAAGLEGSAGEKLEFAAELIVDAFAPTNFFWTNPAARKKALDTGGLSVMRGLRNLLDDVARNGGLPRQVPPDAFTVGKDLAATPGKVVFRNKKMELIQYSAQTKTVHEIPLLLSPPWINKYYIMDLAPQRSFVEWAVQHGHTVFMISYRNPDEAHRNVKLDDYLVNGPLTALDAVCEITGADRVNIVGLCLGGTLTTMLLAYLAQAGDERVHSATLLNTLVDFSIPGRLGAFTDRVSVERLEKRIMRRGYLDKSELANTFTMMRGNDLIWNYAVNNWLLGEDPPAFDILAWNSDGTRMPAAMHTFYIRSCYLDNELARGEMEIAGTTLDLSTIAKDVYVLAAQEDHIAPWKGSYLTTQVLPNADVRFVLSASGHIAGIVNPPSPKAWYLVGESTPPDPEEWRTSATRHEGSWWEDWAEWLAMRAGKRVSPPPMGSELHPAQGDAPGEYVFGK
jgi:polyhydroxyalkanoate synthase